MEAGTDSSWQVVLGEGLANDLGILFCFRDEFWHFFAKEILILFAQAFKFICETLLGGIKNFLEFFLGVTRGGLHQEFDQINFGKWGCLVRFLRG